MRGLANTEAFQISRRERKKVEVRFAHMKGIHKLDRLRLRGLSGAQDEVLLTATAQNLRKARKAPATTDRQRASGVGVQFPSGVGAETSTPANP